jgi:hypothetical protein
MKGRSTAWPARDTAAGKVLWKGLGVAVAWTLLCAALPLRAQEFRFERFTVNDGLASSKVFCVAQDPSGLIWIGTELGLCRYNGSEFQTFSVLDGLPGNSVIDIQPDASGRKWLSLQAGSGYWQRGAYYPLRLPEGQAGPGDRIRSVASGADGVLYGASNSAVWRYNGSGLQRVEGPMPEGAQLYRVQDESTMWYGTGRYLVRYHQGRTDTLLKHNTFVKRQFLIGGKAGELYAVSSQGVWLLNGDRAEPVYPALRELLQTTADLSAVFIDPEGNWWLGSFEGGLYFLPEDQLGQGRSVVYLREEGITEIFQDRDDNLWVGTDAAGLFLLSYRARQVRNLRMESGPLMDELFSRRIRSADGVQWTIRRERQGTVLSALHPDGDSLRLVQAGNPYKLIRGPGHSVLATTSSGFYQLDWRRADSLARGQRSLSAEPFLLLSGPARVAWYDSLLERSWLYTMGGLLGYDGQRFDTLVPNTEERKLIISGMASVPGSHRIWMSSYGLGLLLWQGDSLHRFGTAEGLNSNNLVDVWLNERGELWVIGSNGVNKLMELDSDPPRFKVYSLYENDGLIMGEVRAGLERRDTIWLRTNAGLSYFPASLITRQPNTQPGLEITGVIIDFRDTVLLPAYSLAYHQNDLEVRFSAIAFSDSRRIRYRYRVLGLSEDWQETEFGELRLAKLRPGSYTLELRSVDIYDMESPETARITFEIHPAIWQQRGYQVLAGMLLLVLSAGVVGLETRRRARQREAQLILEKQLAETEQKALRAQMNPHFIYNVLNSIQQFILRNDTEAALDYLGEFGDLIRRSFENSKHMAIPLRDEIAFLNTYLMLEKMRFDDMLSYRIEVEPGVDEASTLVPSLLIQPFVENSIRHGLRHKEGAGRIDINFSRQGDNLVCTIDDDGVGIEQAREMENWKPEEHRSSGMEITRSRLELFNRVNPGKVGMEVLDRKVQGGSGTRVVLTIPMLVEDQKRVTDGTSERDTVRDRRRRAEGPGIPT